MSKQIFKLSPAELTQAVADYLTKNYPHLEGDGTVDIKVRKHEIIVEVEL